MMPIGPLMIEHRLIERMIEIVHGEVRRFQENRQADPLLIDTIADFIRVYADRTHHGKEEGILFRDLAKKELSDKDRSVMLELVAEHEYTRSLVGDLVLANGAYLQNRNEAFEVVLERLTSLVVFYPQHIAKEDKVFFPACMRYFARQEQDAMLAEMWEFDRSMIHEKYRAVVERLQRR